MEELKKLLQAIVISNSGTAMTVAQLNRDFKSNEGEDIPYRRYGFQQLDGMLRTMPDVVQLNGQGSSALVLPVTTEKSQHIRAMIEKQKKNGKSRKGQPTHSSHSNRNEYVAKTSANAKHKTSTACKSIASSSHTMDETQKKNGKNRKGQPTHFSHSNRNEYVAKTNANAKLKTSTACKSIASSSHTMDELKKIIKAIITSNRGNMTVAGLNSFFKLHECVDIPFRHFGFPQLDVMLRSLSDIVQLSGQGPSALVLPAVTPSKFQHTERPVKQYNTNVVNRVHQTSPPSGGSTCAQLEDLKKKIQALITSNVGPAMTVAQLNRDFKHREGKEIPYRRFGFQQLDGMLRAMPDIVQLNGQGSSAFVSPVIIQKSQHEREMIAKQKNNTRKRGSQCAYAQNNNFDHSSNGHCNNTGWTRPDNNLNWGAMHNNSSPTDREKIIMEMIANYAKQFWY